MYKKDCRKIQLAYLRKGLFISMKEAERLWKAYSEEIHCGWCNSIEGITLNDVYKYTNKYCNKHKMAIKPFLDIIEPLLYITLFLLYIGL